MTKRIKSSELPEFDAAEYLSSEDDVAAYLTTILEENDAALLAAALGDIARSRGMTQVAKDSGITREALYKALRPGSEPRFDTVTRTRGRAWRSTGLHLHRREGCIAPAASRLRAMQPGGMCQYTVRISGPAEIDAQLLAWIEAAYVRAG
jgi:probable addiction module antidote protein